MADYRVAVKTGDVVGAGTDANVRIILHGKGTQTEDFLLDKAWRDDFERNAVDEFTVKSITNIPEVEKIELWRDSAGYFSSWYVDYIEVTNLGTGITSMFPAMRWIRENKRYFISNIDTSLPQNDPFKDLRAMELKAIQQTYQLEVKVPGAPAQVKELPEDEKFSFQYQFDIGFKKKTLEAASQLQVLANGIQWKNIDDIKGCYVKPFDVPKGSLHYNDDAWFGRQRLAGLNSLIIKLCTDIPEKFGVTEAMVSSQLEGKTLKQAMEMKKLFILDLEILEGAPTSSSEFVVPAPIALFYFNDDKRLMPIAIQLNQQKGPKNPVFLPTDPRYTWMLAKMWFNLADAHYHQSLSHLTFTHLIMEGVAVSSKRQLSPSHPILKLLNPHFLYLMSINYLALGTLVNPDGYIDKYSNGGIKTLFFLVTKSMTSWRLDVQGTLPEDLKSRGVFDQSVLEGAYHVRDDGMMFYNAIKAYVEEYVSHYYTSKGSLTDDYELQEWGKELVKSRDEGGVGMLGVPNNGQFETMDHLIVTLTAVIYTCSVGHAKANFQQYDEYGAPFSYPYMLIGTPPTTKTAITEEDILKSVGNRLVLLNTMSITAVLSEKGTQSLGDFEKQYIVDPPAMKIVEKFREQLRAIGTTIDQRNTVRDISYEYLHPIVVPNAISI